jgi:hypothetical protein
MPNSRTENLRLIKIIGISFVILLIITFAFFRSLNYLKGPSITINYPQNGDIIDSKTTEISGNAKRINKISLNGYPVSIDEQGNWKEMIIIFPGINKITVKVEDQFGRTLVKQLDIVGKTNQ